MATRRDFQNALQMLDRFLEEAVALCVLQIADVLREKRVTAFGQADGVLQFAADSQNRWHIFAQKDRYRHKSARAPQLPRAPAGDANDGIVTAQQDIAIVYKKAVGQPVQPAHRFVVGNANRLLAQVGAGHDQRRK